MNTIKILSLFDVVLLLVTMTLFFAGLISGWWFWGVILISAVFAYGILPKISSLK